MEYHSFLKSYLGIKLGFSLSFVFYLAATFFLIPFLMYVSVGRDFLFLIVARECDLIRKERDCPPGFFFL